VDIALEYGFEYEQSYLKSFKREFGVSPGFIRRTSQIVKVTPPLNLLGAKIFENCIIFKPEIVMVPQFHVIGKKHQVSINGLADTTQKISKLFWENERSNITNTTEPDVFIGLTGKDGIDADHQWYFPSIPVKTLKNIPEGFEGYTLNPSLYAMFRYIGQHHYLEINQDLIINSHSAMVNRFNYEYDREFCVVNGTFFVKVYGLSYDGNFCQVEYFAPIKKISNDEK
jgi:AraC family transcriptional regulator